MKFTHFIFKSCLFLFLFLGGVIPKNSELGKGFFYPPTVLADVSESAWIAQEEIFGPIMCIFKVFFRVYFYFSVVLM